MKFTDWASTRRPTETPRGSAVRAVQAWLRDGVLPVIDSADDLVRFAESKGSGEVTRWALRRLYEEWRDRN